MSVQSLTHFNNRFTYFTVAWCVVILRKKSVEKRYLLEMTGWSVQIHFPWIAQMNAD
jgi:hypothetical protein